MQYVDAIYLIGNEDTDFLRSFPKLHRSLVTLEGVQMVEMKTVVKATLLLMEDQERNGREISGIRCG